MLAHRLTIQHHDYVLHDSTDVDALQLEICEAMRKGGGIVSFTTSTHRPLTAIISPGVPVIFESFAPADHSAGSSGHHDVDTQAWPDEY